MKTLLLVIPAAIMLTACNQSVEIKQITETVGRQIKAQAVVTVNSDDSTIQARPTGVSCSVWQTSIDTSSIEKSLQQSISHSFTQRGEKYKVNVDIKEVDVSYKFIPGYFGQTVDADADISLKVTFSKADGAWVATQFVNEQASAEEPISAFENCDGSAAIDKALAKATKRTIRSTLNFLETEARFQGLY